MNNPQIREPKAPSKGLTARRVAWDLSKLPKLIQQAEARRDKVRAEYDDYLAGLAIDAISALVLPGTLPDDAKRAAKTVDERKMALEFLCSQEPEFKALREELDTAKREVEALRNQQENLHVVARLMLNN